MSEKEWTADDWAAWRAENLRLACDGWVLGTDMKSDGTVEQWAEKDGIRMRRDPQWIRDAEGNYIYGAAT